MSTEQAAVRARGEHGIWSQAAGGFIEVGLWGDTAELGASVSRWLGRGEHADDLTVMALCGDHEEQPLDTCEDCFAEQTEQSL